MPLSFQSCSLVLEARISNGWHIGYWRFCCWEYYICGASDNSQGNTFLYLGCYYLHQPCFISMLQHWIKCFDLFVQVVYMSEFVDFRPIWADSAPLWADKHNTVKIETIREDWCCLDWWHQYQNLYLSSVLFAFLLVGNRYHDIADGQQLTWNMWCVGKMSRMDSLWASLWNWAYLLYICWI